MIKRLIGGIKKKMSYYGGIAGLIVYSFPALIKSKRGRSIIFRVLVMQVYFTGVQAIRVVGVVGIALGSVIIIQLFTQIPAGAVSGIAGKVMVLVVMRELGPLITAIIVLGRSGTAITTEIGNMIVNNELEALEMMGIDPLQFLIAPRVVGMVIALTFLFIYFVAISFLGGFLIANLVVSLPLDVFFESVFRGAAISDLSVGILKSIMFGAVIAAVAVYYGFQVRQSITEVPQVTTQSVVKSIFMIFVVNTILTIIFYM